MGFRAHFDVGEPCDCSDCGWRVSNPVKAKLADDQWKSSHYWHGDAQYLPCPAKYSFKRNTDRTMDAFFAFRAKGYSLKRLVEEDMEAHAEFVDELLGKWDN